MGRRSTPDLRTIASAVYDRIRQDILAGRLPPHLKLRIDALCERYESGSSPVREALNRLSSEGLVERHEQRGFRVADISDDDLSELVETRCWLESLALRDSIANATAEWHESIVLALHRLSRAPRSIDPDVYRENPEWEALHRTFHRTIIGQCRSKRLLRYCDDLSDQAYRYRQVSIEHTFPTRDIAAEHAAMAKAIFDQDTNLAVKLLTDHYRRTANALRARSDATGSGRADDQPRT